VGEICISAEANAVGRAGEGFPVSTPPQAAEARGTTSIGSSQTHQQPAPTLRPEAAQRLALSGTAMPRSLQPGTCSLKHSGRWVCLPAGVRPNNRCLPALAAGLAGPGHLTAHPPSREAGDKQQYCKERKEPRQSHKRPPLRSLRSSGQFRCRTPQGSDGNADIPGTMSRHTDCAPSPLGCQAAA